MKDCEGKFASGNREPRRRDEDAEKLAKAVMRGMGVYAVAFTAALVAVALAIGNSNEEDTDRVACTGWTEFELSAGEPGYSAAISRVEFGPGVTQQEVTDAMAERNGTNVPRAGIVYEAPSRCEQDG